MASGVVEAGAQRRDTGVRQPPARAQPGPSGQIGLQRSYAAARLELADGAHENAAGEPERRRERLAELVVGPLGDHARATVHAAGRDPRERTRRPAELTLDRLAVALRRSFHERKCGIPELEEERRP